MNIVILGAPGSGKGTQAKLLANNLGLFHLSTGEIFRKIKNSDNEIKEIIQKGDLVPDDKVVNILRNYLEKNSLYDDLIIDGSPRSLYQYEKLKKMFAEKGKGIDAAIFISISQKESVKRLSARRRDKKTGKIYNLITNPPGPDVNENDLVQREDDKEEAIRERLRTQKVPKDLLDTIKNDGILVKINGERPIDVIFADILEKLKKNDKNKS